MFLKNAVSIVMLLSIMCITGCCCQQCNLAQTSCNMAPRIVMDGIN